MEKKKALQKLTFGWFKVEFYKFVIVKFCNGCFFSINGRIDPETPESP